MTNEHLKSKRMTANPMDVLRNWFGVKPEDVPWIIYDPGVNPQYRIRRRSTHDGTFLFSKELAARTLERVVTRTGYCTSEPIAEEDWPFITYRVGDIRVATSYGTYKLPCGWYPAQREGWTMPVRVEIRRTP